MQSSLSLCSTECVRSTATVVSTTIVIHIHESHGNHLARILSTEVCLSMFSAPLTCIEDSSLLFFKGLTPHNHLSFLDFNRVQRY